MPSQRMAVVRTVGSPEAMAGCALPALYGAAYALRTDLRARGRTFELQPLRARWPDAHLLPRERWTGLWGLPILEDVRSMPQRVPGTRVDVEVWEYGTVAEILHAGSFDSEWETVEDLRRFIRESGYVIAGVHEEEYLSRPDATVPRTLIRYAIAVA